MTTVIGNVSHEQSNFTANAIQELDDKLNAFIQGQTSVIATLEDTTEKHILALMAEVGKRFPM